ncbi:MAG: hypothetical protein ABL958_11810 [Bdellovibrionia bacterium]
MKAITALGIVLGFAIQAQAQFKPRPPAPTPAPLPQGPRIVCDGLKSEITDLTISQNPRTRGIEVVFSYDIDIPAVGGQGWRRFDARGTVTPDSVNLELLTAPNGSVIGTVTGFWRTDKYELIGRFWNRETKFVCLVTKP